MEEFYNSSRWNKEIISKDKNGKANALLVGTYEDLMALAEQMQDEINRQCDHIKCLQAELEEAQKADSKINHNSDQIVIQRDVEPIDIAAALINADWINLGDLQEIAEHLQAAYKNLWGA